MQGTNAKKGRYKTWAGSTLSHIEKTVSFITWSVINSDSLCSFLCLPNWKLTCFSFGSRTGRLIELVGLRAHHSGVFPLAQKTCRSPSEDYCSISYIKIPSQLIYLLLKRFFLCTFDQHSTSFTIRHRHVAKNCPLSICIEVLFHRPRKKHPVD